MTRSAALTDRSGQAPVSPDRYAVPPPSLRRRLQLVFAGLWLLDGMLKLQPFMFADVCRVVIVLVLTYAIVTKLV